MWAIGPFPTRLAFLSLRTPGPSLCISHRPWRTELAPRYSSASRTLTKANPSYPSRTIMTIRVQQADDVPNELLVAQLEIISYEALRDGSEVEAAKLFNACCHDGVFYLDMTGTEPDILKSVDDIYALERGIFDLPEEELMRYDIDVLSPRKLNGYKPIGRNRGELIGGKDGFQSYALPKDGILNLGRDHFKRPQIVDTHMHFLRSFSLAVATAATTILNSLSSTLKLSPLDSLQTSHRPQLASPNLIRLLKYAAQPLSERGSSHIPHTDLGSLTFLFTRQYGLQILGAESGAWEWVKPRAGYATVNLGDCLSLLTNKVLKSCRHRVNALPGRAMEERYSFAYFLRPQDETIMRPVRSPLMSVAEVGEGEPEFTSAEWMRRKYAMLRGETWNEKSSWILTGA